MPVYKVFCYPIRERWLAKWAAEQGYLEPGEPIPYNDRQSFVWLKNAALCLMRRLAGPRFTMDTLVSVRGEYFDCIAFQSTNPRDELYEANREAIDAIKKILKIEQEPTWQHCLDSW